MSGVIVAISGVIEEKTKKLDIGDPMDAIRNLRIENLNSKAMKKLGYKVDENIRMPPKMMKSSVNTQRRGTIVPDDDERGLTPGEVTRSRASLQNRMALLNERVYDNIIKISFSKNILKVFQLKRFNLYNNHEEAITKLALLR